MPVPSPHPDEDQETFHSRCMGDKPLFAEFPDQAQRNAVCYSAWERHHAKKTGEAQLDLIKAALERPLTYEQVLQRPQG